MSVLTWVEHDEAEVAKASVNVLSFARELANVTASELHAAVLAPIGEPALATLREQGVAVVHSVDHDLLDGDPRAAIAAALTQLLARQEPDVVVAPATDRGNELLAHVAASGDLALVSNCLAVSPCDGGWQLTRQRWGGVLLEDARLETATALVTAVPHALVATPAPAPGVAEVVAFAPELDEALAVTRVRERVIDETGVSLATAPVVVSGGRGIGSAEGFAGLEELAELLGGAVGCSRIATNNGWRSHNDQVGQTGTRVAPELYLALGISGATQHWVGCMNAKRILAVNLDVDAPLVGRAHDAVIGDVHELLPALLAEVRARKRVR